MNQTITCTGLFAYTEDGHSYALDIAGIIPSRFEIDSDLVLVKVRNSPQNPVMKVSEHFSKTGDRVYSLGFPPVTKRAENSKLIQNGIYRDADGGFRISRGRLLAPKKTYFYFGHQGLYSDVDGLQGSSGSSLVSERGELIGILQGPGNGAGIPGGECSSSPTFLYCHAVIYHLEIQTSLKALNFYP